MNDPVKLVAPPSITSEAKADAKKIIDDLRRMHDADDIAEIFSIVKHPDGSWSTHHSASLSRPLMVGYLEIAKQGMIRKYLEE